jgi:hypothetical protein
MDSLVWGGTDLMLGPGHGLFRWYKKKAQEEEKAQNEAKVPKPLNVEAEERGDVSSPKERQTIWRDRVVKAELTRTISRPQKVLESKGADKLCPDCSSLMRQYSEVSVCSQCGLKQRNAVRG